MAEKIIVNISSEEIKATVPDINYIPAYKVAEEQRRANELERISNENERIEYYEEIQNKVANGDFNGEQGPQGIQGIQGPQGPKGDAPDMSDYYNKTDIDTMIGDIESLLSEV